MASVVRRGLPGLPSGGLPGPTLPSGVPTFAQRPTLPSVPPPSATTPAPIPSTSSGSMPRPRHVDPVSKPGGEVWGGTQQVPPEAISSPPEVSPGLTVAPGVEGGGGGGVPGIAGPGGMPGLALGGLQAANQASQLYNPGAIGSMPGQLGRRLLPNALSALTQMGKVY